ncbi:DegV domain-containing protein [bioreactor metagenome]|uniref:DegV domain-containing protein n=1 Tax=bioreactor metagenome TaxID=1076179 RepID=A0A645AFK2_9ZZZZ|nr:DegV family protein [Christensenella sp.]
MKYNLVADSCCDLTEELRKEWGVTSVPLTLTLAEESYTDDDNLDLPNFMQRMHACKGRVGSAAPAPGQYAEAFGGGESFAVTLSSSLSGSYASAMMGKSVAEESGAKVHVFDSRSAAAAEVLIVMKIRKFIAEGLQRSEIIQKVEHFIKEMRTFFVLDNIDNLLKNGRLNRITATIISTLHIRPIMGADGDGNISLFSHVQGWKQVVRKLADTIETDGRSTDGQSLVITHCNNPSLAEELKAEIERRYRFSEILVLPTRGVSSLYANDKGVIMSF